MGLVGKRVWALALAAIVTACQVPAVSVPSIQAPVDGLAALKAKRQAKRHIALGFRKLPTNADITRLLGDLPVQVRRALPETHSLIVTPTGTGDAALLKRLAALPGVEYAEWEGIGSVMADFAGPSPVMAANKAGAAPAKASESDPRLGEQWALEAIKAREAWTLTRGSPKTVIAIVDTGIDLKHPDLAPKIVAGYNAANPSKPPLDDLGHGTHVAGIAAAMTGNGEGIAGMAPAARLMPIKVNLEGSTSLEESTVAAGILWAANHGADVINLSFGFAGDDGSQFRTLGRAVYHALRKNCVVVAAMGNHYESEGARHKVYPAAWSQQQSFSELIAVGATTPDDARWKAANTGPWTTLSAPGFKILSTTPTYQVPLTGYKDRQSGDDVQLHYGRLSGTSMAVPMVSGVAALMLHRMRTPEPGLVKLKLQYSADRLRDADLGAGRLNALSAVRDL